jgi:[calcium/calmodulin-dependent protein kinase] kinase
MASSGASGSSSISQSPSAVFDPVIVTVTNKLTARYLNDGETRTKPMLNNYIRHARIGGGQHGEVYLCFRIDSRLPTDDPQRLMPVVSSFRSLIATGLRIQLEGFVA